MLLLSKVLPLFIYPLGLLFILAVIGWLLRYRWTGGVVLLIAVVQLWAASTPLVATWICGSLEVGQTARLAHNYPTADAVVVLGGAISPAQLPRVYADLNSSGDRVLFAARLYRARRSGTVLVSGGVIPWTGHTTSEAEAMKSLLVEWGVHESAIGTEVKSRNTAENAAGIRRLYPNLRKILLVTSAMHMPRAEAVFGRAGFEVIPAPTDFQVLSDRPFTAFELLPDAHALALTSDAIKEYLGMLYYRLRGWV